MKKDKTIKASVIVFLGLLIVGSISGLLISGFNDKLNELTNKTLQLEEKINKIGLNEEEIAGTQTTGDTLNPDEASEFATNCSEGRFFSGTYDSFRSAAQGRRVVIQLGSFDSWTLDGPNKSADGELGPLWFIHRQFLNKPQDGWFTVEPIENTLLGDFTFSTTITVPNAVESIPDQSFLSQIEFFPIGSSKRYALQLWRHSDDLTNYYVRTKIYDTETQVTTFLDRSGQIVTTEPERNAQQKIKASTATNSFALKGVKLGNKLYLDLQEVQRTFKAPDTYGQQTIKNYRINELDFNFAASDVNYYYYTRSANAVAPTRDIKVGLSNMSIKGCIK